MICPMASLWAAGERLPDIGEDIPSSESNRYGIMISHGWMPSPVHTVAVCERDALNDAHYSL